MSDKADASQEQFAGAPAKPGFWAKVKAHFKRFWWLHLAIFCAIVLIIALPVVYVGYPNIAQDDVNDSTLEVTSMEITDPAPENFHINLEQIIRSSSNFHPNLDPFNVDVSLSGGNPAFMTLRVPGVHSTDYVPVTINQDVQLNNVDAFTEFAVASMLNEDIQMNVYGETGLKLGALPHIDVVYNKTVNMKGLNKLDGLNITKIELVNEDDYNMKGNVFIPNPTVMTLTLGNVSLDLSVDGTPIGTSVLPDLILKPGDNNVPMQANTNQSHIIGLITDSDSPYSKTGTIPIDIAGKSAVYNGKELTYFSKALQSNMIQVPLNVLGLLSG